mmetsp:Transcript_5431/g.7698  ORF Transcript_5431/g.7698 Transcript_5431/m.7698 type:complete len:137 (+) Transcript_5431:115-525(+)
MQKINHRATSHPSDLSTAIPDLSSSAPKRSFLELLNCCAPKPIERKSTDVIATETVLKIQTEPIKDIEEEEKTHDVTLPEVEDKPIDFDLPELEETESEQKPVETNTIFVSFFKIIYTILFFNFFGEKQRKTIKNA